MEAPAIRCYGWRSPCWTTDGLAPAAIEELKHSINQEIDEAAVRASKRRTQASGALLDLVYWEESEVTVRTGYGEAIREGFEYLLGSLSECILHRPGTMESLVRRQLDDRSGSEVRSRNVS